MSLAYLSSDQHLAGPTSKYSETSRPARALKKPQQSKLDD